MHIGWKQREDVICRKEKGFLKHLMNPIGRRDKQGSGGVTQRDRERVQAHNLQESKQHIIEKTFEMLQ